MTTAIGDYLETACEDADSLARAYARALDSVGTDHLDVDIETDAGREVDLDRVPRLSVCCSVHAAPR